MAEAVATKKSSAVMKFVRYWLPVVLLLVAIYAFAGDTFSDRNTQGRVTRLLVWLFPDISGRTLFWTNYTVRKMAHFVEYAALAALLFRAFRADNSLRWRLSWAVYSIIITVLWASLDEYKQSLIPSRSGSSYDVMIDSAGGLFALAVIYWFARRRERRNVI